MITIRKSNQRGKGSTDWLKSFHSFSFAEYYDPEHMHFGSLRVINEDTIQPGCGFGKHPHNDMEIITYVISGTLAHKDSMGTGSLIRPGEIQRMSAGTGVEHSEFNQSESEPLHLLQIWIIPKKTGITPSYEQKTIPQLNNEFILIGSHADTETAITIHQDVELYVAYLQSKHSLSYEFKNNRKAWLQLIKGKINLNGETLSTGDGAAIKDEKTVTIEGVEEAELLFFDLK